MKQFSKRVRLGAIALGLGVGLLGAAAAQAWWNPYWGGYGGGPYGYGYGPYGGHGPGASGMTFDRQNMMREHGRGMRQLARMIDGRSMFDRRKATTLAREIESGAGENLWRLYAPGSFGLGSRTMPHTWGDFDTFKGHADQLKAAAANLADALEKRPTRENIQEGVWIPPNPANRHGYGYGHGGYGPWGYGGGPYGGVERPWGQRGGGITKAALEALDDLKEACVNCHANYRGSRWIW